MTLETTSSFVDLGLSDQLLKAVEEAGYSKPTPIQEIASDINGDGLLNVLDVVLIVNLALDN